MKQKRRRERSVLEAAWKAIGVGVLVSAIWAIRLAVELYRYYHYNVHPQDPMFHLYMLIHFNQSGEIYSTALFNQLQNDLDVQDVMIGTLVPTFFTGLAFGVLVPPRIPVRRFLAWATATVLAPWVFSMIFILLAYYARYGHIDISRFTGESYVIGQSVACAIWLAAGLLGAGMGKAFFNRPPASADTTTKKRRRAAAAR